MGSHPNRPSFHSLQSFLTAITDDQRAKFGTSHINLAVPQQIENVGPSRKPRSGESTQQLSTLPNWRLPFCFAA